jgi:hypothetical protein
MSEAQKEAVIRKHRGKYTSEMQYVMRELNHEDDYSSGED